MLEGAGTGTALGVTAATEGAAVAGAGALDAGSPERLSDPPRRQTTPSPQSSGMVRFAQPD